MGVQARVHAAAGSQAWASQGSFYLCHQKGNSHCYFYCYFIVSFIVFLLLLLLFLLLVFIVFIFY